MPSPSALPYCLFLSGAAALIYEVVWLRRVALVMGHTSYATAALLSAFLGGLALGAYLCARWLRTRTATARTYAGIEIAVAATALVVPVAIDALSPAFGVVYRATADRGLLHAVLQFGLCTVVLGPPTVLMGATLPVVMAALAPDGRLVGTAGRLYALNSAGGVVGAAAAGLWLLPMLGEMTTTACAAVLNGFAAAFALTAGPAPASTAPGADGTGGHPGSADEAPRPESSSAERSIWPAPGPAGLLALYGLGGAAAIGLQVAWSRVLGLAFGSTIFGFTITVVAFISGLTLGSLVIARWSALARVPVRSVFLLHAFIALGVSLGMGAIGRIPAWTHDIMATDLGFAGVWLAELGLAFATIVVPTAAMGAIFPLVAELIRAQGAGPGVAVGRAFAVNTLGNIAGALAAGFIAVPNLGMQGTLRLVAAMSVGLAVAYAIPALLRAHRVAWGSVIGVVAVVAVALVVTPSWDTDLMTSAPYLSDYQSRKADDRSPLGRLIDRREGPSTVATVRRWSTGTVALYSGGVLEAASPAPAHDFLAHLALLLAGGAENVLVVGLGAGSTLASVVEHPVTAVDCVEIAPEIVAAVRANFPRASSALADPRVRLRIADGRAHVRHTRARYDAIISQPSYPWASGAARLFTREYFEDLRRRLTPGGVAVVWFATESEPSTASLLATWSSVFPSTYLFSVHPRFPLVYAVGFADGVGPDPAAIARALGAPRVAAAAARLGIGTPDAVLSRVTAGPEQVAERGRGAPLNTDDFGFVEVELFRTLTTRRWKKP